jgi:biopolymer transport protein ExbD
MGPLRDAADEAEVLTEINTTPLIDVMLVLLIMLIVTIPIQLHSVDLAMPAGQTPPADKPVVIRVEIDRQGTVWWDAQALAGPDELQARLQEAAARPVQPELHLRPDRQARYEVVAAVLAASQRAGVTRIGILGAEQFAQ